MVAFSAIKPPRRSHPHNHKTETTVLGEAAKLTLPLCQLCRSRISAAIFVLAVISFDDRSEAIHLCQPGIAHWAFDLQMHPRQGIRRPL